MPVNLDLNAVQEFHHRKDRKKPYSGAEEEKSKVKRWRK
jgi:hypothetical protein